MFDKLSREAGRAVELLPVAPGKQDMALETVQVSDRGAKDDARTISCKQERLIDDREGKPRSLSEYLLTGML